MNWIDITDLQQLDEIVAESKKQPVIIYKHSTRCNISRTALDRLDRQWDPKAAGETKRYLLDLIAYRHISNRIAELFGVEHESPQVLVIADGRSIADMSHFAIDFEAVKTHLTPA
jgi:bacillithiol system protein YtxJ